MRPFRIVLQLFDAYGSLWLAIVAAIGVAYLYTPAMKAVEEHERREIEKWRNSMQARPQIRHDSVTERECERGASTRG